MKILISKTSITLEHGVSSVVPTPSENRSKKKYTGTDINAPNKDEVKNPKIVKVDSMEGVARGEICASLTLPSLLASSFSQQPMDMNKLVFAGDYDLVG